MDVVFDRKLSLFLQEQNAARRKLLRRRTDVEYRLRRNRDVLLDVRETVALFVDNLPAAINSQRAARRSRRRQILKYLIDRCVQSLLVAVTLAGRVLLLLAVPALGDHTLLRTAASRNQSNMRRAQQPSDHHRSATRSKKSHSPSPESRAECICNISRLQSCRRLQVTSECGGSAPLVRFDPQRKPIETCRDCVSWPARRRPC